MDKWNGGLASLRQFLRACGANLNENCIKDKKAILDHLNILDRKTNDKGLSAKEWIDRYKAKSELEKLYDIEERYWQQRGQEKWIIQGDSNTRFFHSCANGRRRKNYL